MKGKIKKKAEKDRYNWVLRHLKSNTRLKSNPYLWTRIQAHLESRKNSISEESRYAKNTELLQRALPLILLVTISIGIFVGFQLSTDIQSYTESAGDRTKMILKEYETTLLPEEPHDLQLPALKMEVQDE